MIDDETKTGARRLLGRMMVFCYAAAAVLALLTVAALYASIWVDGALGDRIEGTGVLSFFVALGSAVVGLLAGLARSDLT